MKILFIIPGSGDSFYCGNCFRDNILSSALKKRGHDVVIMPLYLPLKQKSFQADTPLYFPATTFFVAQKFFNKSKTPKWIERITNTDAMLSLASSLSATTSAEGMEEMTLSMITGEGAAFKEHIKLLISRVKEEKPDIIHLSSTLLLGVTKTLRQHIDIPVICSLQDEEVWIDSLDNKYSTVCWQSIEDNISHVDHFIASSEYYKGVAQERMPMVENIDVVYLGFDIGKYASSEYPKDPVIGFFYRMNKANGLDILADAFVILKKRGTIPNLKLKIGGGYSHTDKKFLRGIRKTLSPYKNDVEIATKYNLEEHWEFYKSVSVISNPLTFNEAASLFLAEAFAAGRPVVEPATGSFPEMVGECGILYESNNSESLADSLEKILTDKELYFKLAENAKQLAHNRYNDKISGERLSAIYEQYVGC